MPDRLPLAVAILTLNEERNLPRCLESLGNLAAEILVLDSGSTDRTEAIARDYQARFEVSEWSGFVKQRAKALERCSQPWILCLDADEALTPELARSIELFLQAADPAVAGAEVTRRTYYLGDWIWHTWYPEWRLRLVRRGSAKSQGTDPHDHLEVRGDVRRLPGDLLHYSFVDLADHLDRSMQYARISAEAYANAGRRFRWSQLLVSPAVAVFKHLVIRQGFRDGWRGWVIAGVKASETFAKYAFLLEHERSPSAQQTPRQAR